MRILQQAYAILWGVILYAGLTFCVWCSHDDTLISWFIGVSAFVGARWFAEHTTPKLTV